MSDSTTRYRPRDYRRVCDVCGNLRNISEMHLQDTLWVCTYDYGERVRTELDRGNAKQRPFQIKPVPHPKPLDNYYPNTLESDDAAVFNFLAQQVTARCRYERVDSGSAPYTSQGGTLPTMGWAARYFYDLIQEGARTRLIAQAKELLATIATYVLTRQRGTPSGFFPSTRASDAFYGGFLASGASVYVTQDTATCGLALLYAYRIHGTLAYIEGARAAASFLRNVQAIGSCAANFTSRDSAGTVRLYTGAICSEVSTVFGGDPSENFYSNHLFYPSGLIALEFWNELKTTDGDQSIGATAAPGGFYFVPAQLISQSIADMRACWENGITDSTATLINGLSTTTPKEVFNAYPATKTGFTVVGTGLWEYADGNASSGTQISAQNFATALSSLYNYEGASSQVTGLSDWLRSFTSNPDFETPDNTSTFELYEGTTGTYDPAIAPATMLQVRDPSTFTATAINGSSLYDWGAFGLLSRIWASRNKASFRQSRLYPLNTVQRFFAGNSTDTEQDKIILRGMSGMSLQTGFKIDLNASTVYAFNGNAGQISTPPTEGLVFWVKGDAGVHTTGNKVTRWDDQSGFHQDLDAPNTGEEPTIGTDTLNGIPGVTFPTLSTNPMDATLTKFLGRTVNLKDRNGNDFGIDTGDTKPRTIIAVIKPRTYNNDSIMLTGGHVVSFRQENPGQTTAQYTFMLQAYFNFFTPIWELYSTDGFYGAFNMKGPNTHGSVYQNQGVLVTWLSDYPSLSVRVNGASVGLTPSEIGTGDADGGLSSDGFIVGNAKLGSHTPNFQGPLFEILIFDRILAPGEVGTAEAYASARFNLGVVNLAMVNDAVRAAQFARSFREARN